MTTYWLWEVSLLRSIAVFNGLQIRADRRQLLQRCDITANHLMVDQVQSLRRRGVCAAFMSCGGSMDMSRAKQMSRSSHLYCSPEAVQSRWREVMEKPVISSRIVAVVVDEVYCVPVVS